MKFNSEIYNFSILTEYADSFNNIGLNKKELKLLEKEIFPMELY